MRSLLIVVVAAWGFTGAVHAQSTSSRSNILDVSSATGTGTIRGAPDIARAGDTSFALGKIQGVPVPQKVFYSMSDRPSSLRRIFASFDDKLPAPPKGGHGKNLPSFTLQEVMVRSIQKGVREYHREHSVTPLPPTPLGQSPSYWFVARMLWRIRVRVPLTENDLVTLSKATEAPTHFQPGDIILFRPVDPGETRLTIALYYQQGKIAYACNTTRRVYIAKIGSTEWRDRFAGRIPVL